MSNPSVSPVAAKCSFRHGVRDELRHLGFQLCIAYWHVVKHARNEVGGSDAALYLPVPNEPIAHVLEDAHCRLEPFGRRLMLPSHILGMLLRVIDDFSPVGRDE